jgi:small-conductance mechanosensitive channel
MLAEPAPDVMLEGVDATGLIFVATGYVSTPRITYRVRSALLFVILKKLNEAGLPLSNPPTLIMKESAAGEAR